MHCQKRRNGAEKILYIYFTEDENGAVSDFRHNHKLHHQGGGMGSGVTQSVLM